MSGWVDGGGGVLVEVEVEVVTGRREKPAAGIGLAGCGWLGPRMAGCDR